MPETHLGHSGLDQTAHSRPRKGCNANDRRVSLGRWAQCPCRRASRGCGHRSVDRYVLVAHRCPDEAGHPHVRGFAQSPKPTTLGALVEPLRGTRTPKAVGTSRRPFAFSGVKTDNTKMMGEGEPMFAPQFENEISGFAGELA